MPATLATDVSVPAVSKKLKQLVCGKKKSSTFKPDFCPIRLDYDPWIVQPTEHYEELSIEEIIKRN